MSPPSKPLDEDAAPALRRQDGTRGHRGGPFHPRRTGRAVAELLGEVMPTPVKRLGVTGFGESGDAKGLYAKHGLDPRRHRAQRCQVPEPLIRWIEDGKL